MKSTVFRFGIYSGLLILVFAAIHFFLLSGFDYDSQEVIGYLTMVLSMIFVFAGIRHYRDRINNGSLTFGRGLKIGLLIVLFPSLLFGLFDVLYTEVINPAWMNDYFSHYIAEVKANIPADKVDAEIKKLQAQKELFSNPLMQFLIMSFTVFIIGMIVTIISALALRRKRLQLLSSDNK